MEGHYEGWQAGLYDVALRTLRSIISYRAVNILPRGCKNVITGGRGVPEEIIQRVSIRIGLIVQLMFGVGKDNNNRSNSPVFICEY